MCQPARPREAAEPSLPPALPSSRACLWPMPCCSSQAMTAALAWSVARPFRSSPLLLLAELTATPGAVNASAGASPLLLAAAAASAATTCRTGRLKACTRSRRRVHVQRWNSDRGEGISGG